MQLRFFLQNMKVLTEVAEKNITRNFSGMKLEVRKYSGEWNTVELPRYVAFLFDVELCV